MKALTLEQLAKENIILGVLKVKEQTVDLCALLTLPFNS